VTTSPLFPNYSKEAGYEWRVLKHFGSPFS
jgi:hypothetical protein